MEKKRELLEFEIILKEKTKWGVVIKNFSNNKINVERSEIIVQFIEYLRENCREDYIKAVKILRQNRSKL